MGNCCRRGSSSSAVWAGDDWESVGQESEDNHHHTIIESTRLLGEDSSSTGEVKIKINKRELQELMARVDMQGLSMEQVVASLINSSSSSPHNYNLEMEYYHHTSWKPALQSIPE